MHLTLQELADAADVSPSHLGRIEKGSRYPSGHVLKRISKPLGYDENELFTLAGYLSDADAQAAEKSGAYVGGHLDPYVAKVLGQESTEVQHAVLGLITIIKNVAKGLPRRASDFEAKTPAVKAQ